jgi:hypothetical protein
MRGGIVKHGHTVGGTQSPTYSTWMCMMRRCYDRKFKDYENYGGRGMTVCSRWFEFRSFLEDMGPRPIGTLIDRINRQQGYSRKNCRWSTYQESAVNRSSTRIVIHENRYMTATQCAKRLGVSVTAVCLFLKRNKGWLNRNIALKPWGSRKRLVLEDLKR